MHSPSFLSDFSLRINLTGSNGKITPGTVKSQISSNGANGLFCKKKTKNSYALNLLDIFKFRFYVSK